MNYDAYIDIGTFLEYYFYHALYFQVLGPFSILVLMILNGPKRGWKLACNLRWWGCTWWHLQQFVNFMSVGAVNINQATNRIHLRPPVIYIINLYTVFRCCMIAAKYATLEKQYLRDMKTKDISVRTGEKLHTVGGWRNQHPKLVDREIAYVILRQQIDPPGLWIQFMKPIHPKKRKEILACQSDYMDDVLR